MRGVWHTGDCGKGAGSGALASLVDVLVPLAAIGGVVAAAVSVFLLIFHYIVDALTVVGLIAMIGCGLYVRLKWKRWQNMPQAQPQPVRGRRQAPPVTAPQQPQAIPAATVHNHYGHTLQLPDGMTGEDLAKVFGRRGN